MQSSEFNAAVMRWCRSYLLSCLLLAVVGLPLAAQDGCTAGGVVVDATGAVVRGTNVAVIDANEKELARSPSGADGHFAFHGLAKGTYTLVSDAGGGFASARLPVVLNSDMLNLRLVIPVAVFQEKVDVGPDQGLSTDAASNKDATTLDTNALETLPVFDQDYIAMLSPLLDQSALGTGGASITVDGVEASTIGVTPSAIQEIRINNDPYSAESNRPGRARIEIITKRATKDYHGTLNFIFRDSPLNASNYFAPVNPPEQRRIYEGSVLGPLHGRFGFLLSASRREEDLSSSVHALGAQGPIATNVSTPTREDNVTFRVGRDFNDNHRAYLQYGYEDSSATNQGVGGLVLPEAGTNDSSWEHRITVNDRLTLSPNLINQFGATYGKSKDTFQSVTNAQALIVKGYFTGGGAQADLYRTEDTLRLNDVMSWTHGRHYIRFGANIPQISRRAWDDRTNRLGTFSFANLASFQANRPYAYTVQQGPGRAVFWFNEVGGFFQDQIKLTKNVQASIGLRYDWQTFLHDNNNFAPRASLAWSPGKSQKTVIRIGYGVFFDRTGGDTLANIVLHDGVLLRSYQIENPALPESGREP